MLEPEEMLADLKTNISNLKDEIKRLTIQQRQKSDLPPTQNANINMKARKTLTGHLAKVYAMCWAENGPFILSASQDRRLIVWNASNLAKEHAIGLRFSAVMCCAISPSSRFVACGGLDNICTVFSLRSREVPIKPWRELRRHLGFISGVRFLNDEKILTSSGDASSILWDIDSGTPEYIFEGQHEAEIMAMNSLTSNRALFITGSGDSTSKLWDIRQRRCANVFSRESFGAECHSICFFPSGQSFVAGYEDSSCNIFDLRCAGTNYISSFSPNVPNNPGITSTAFSASGRFLFAGCDDFNAYVFDTLSEKQLSVLSKHRDKVSCLGISSDGDALCMGSWDSTLTIWA